VLTISCIATLIEVQELPPESAGWAVQSEWMQKVIGLLEVWSNCVQLMDEVFHTDDPHAAELTLNDRVLRKRDTLAIDLSKSTLVHELTYSLHVRVAVCNVRSDNTEHRESGLVQLDEDSTVNLDEAKELQNLSDLRRDTVDTTNADNDSKLALRLQEVVAR